MPSAPAPEPKVYLTGHVKRNPETGEVAIRTIFPEDQGPQLANMAWLVATQSSGARTLPSRDVVDWPDLYEQPAPTTPPVGE